MARAALRLTAAAMQIRGALMVLISDEDVVLESSLLDGAIWEGHLAVAMLDALLPLAIVHLSIGPQVHALAMSLPVLEVSLVLVAIGVPLIALAKSEIVRPLALVNTVLAVEHNSEALPLPGLELPAK